MLLKDHYRILGLEPSASLAEIKKAYRRLALELHPDVTDSDPYAREKFIAIKEAYEVLIDPVRREKYFQQRWYYQSLGRRKTAGIITPETILKQSLELERYTRSLDVHRMDKMGLYDYVLEILSAENIEKLNEFNEKYINSEITMTLLRCSEPLDQDQEEEIIRRLRIIHNAENALSAMDQFSLYRKNIHRWEKYKIWIVLLLVIIITVLIFTASK